jgi:hypothetical protein
MVQCNGKEPFDHAGAGQVHPGQGRNFLKLFRAVRVSALAMMFGQQILKILRLRIPLTPLPHAVIVSYVS